MKAMVLAAGLGTRLRPLTNDRPKALVEVCGRTLLEITLTRLRHFGIQDVIINVHHYADMVIDRVKAAGNFGMHIEFSREDVLLDTGGGLKKAAWFLGESGDRSGNPGANAIKDEPFILHNVDVISNIDLQRMVEVHNREQGAGNARSPAAQNVALPAVQRSASALRPPLGERRKDGDRSARAADDRACIRRYSRDLAAHLSSADRRRRFLHRAGISAAVGGKVKRFRPSAPTNTTGAISASRKISSKPNRI